MKVDLFVSEQGRREYAVRTGRLPKEHSGSYDLDLASFTPEERKHLITLFGVGERCEEYRYSGPGKIGVFYAPVVPETAADWLIVLTALEQYVAERTAAERVQEEEHAARMAAEKAAVERRRAEKQAELDAQLAALDAEITRLEGLSDEELLAVYDAGERPQAPGSYFLNDISPDLNQRRQILDARVNPLQSARAAEQKAAEESARAAANAEKADWINEHGSDYLKKAIGAGYNCQKKYVFERVAIDHPGAVVDWLDAADWKSRSCPSEAALDKALAVNGTVVWLTEPPKTSKSTETDDEYGYEDGFEPCEAVVLQHYLGKYDLFWTEF